MEDEEDFSCPPDLEIVDEGHNTQEQVEQQHQHEAAESLHQEANQEVAATTQVEQESTAAGSTVVPSVQFNQSIVRELALAIKVCTFNSNVHRGLY